MFANDLLDDQVSRPAEHALDEAPGRLEGERGAALGDALGELPAVARRKKRLVAVPHEMRFHTSGPRGILDPESLSDADDDAAAARPSSVSDGIDEISEPSDENDAESCVSSLEDSEVSIAGQKPNNSRVDISLAGRRHFVIVDLETHEGCHAPRASGVSTRRVKPRC